MRRYMAGLMTAWVLAWAWIIPAASWGADLDQALKDVASYEFGKSRESLAGLVSTSQAGFIKVNNRRKASAC